MLRRARESLGTCIPFSGPPGFWTGCSTVGLSHGLLSSMLHLEPTLRLVIFLGVFVTLAVWE
jgi:hypothetical protein